MSEYIKIIFAVMICCILVVSIKEIKREYSVFLVLLCGLTVIAYTFRDIRILVLRFRDYADTFGVNEITIRIFLKCIGISLVCQFAKEVCADTNNRLLQFSVELIGKVSILLTSLPLIDSVVKIISNYVNF